VIFAALAATTAIGLVVYNRIIAPSRAAGATS
jgi:hypothetical protein